MHIQTVYAVVKMQRGKMCVNIADVPEIGSFVYVNRNMFLPKL